MKRKNLFFLALAGCAEVTKLIPSNQQLNVFGLQPIDFSPKMTPQELLPRLQEGNSVFRLQEELKTARKRFEEIERPEVASRVSEIVSFHEKLDFLVQGIELENFLQGISGWPSAASLSAQQANFTKSTPALKTSFISAVQSDFETPLVQRFSALQILTREPNGFRLMLPQKSFYDSLSTSFDPNALTALESAQDPRTKGGKLKAASEEQAPQGAYTLTRSISHWTYVRSFQPENAFQGFVECSKIHLVLNPKSFSQNVLEDENRNFDEEQGLELSFAWPRLVAFESTPSAMGVSQVQSSKLWVEYRPSLALILPSELSPRFLSASLANIPTEYELLLDRNPDFVNSRYQVNLYDGAGSASGYTLFHEARKLFLFRVGAAVRTPYDVNSLWSSFQIPFGKLIMENKEQRSEFGLSKGDFSDAQKEFLKKGESLDGISTAPPDKWSNAKPIQYYREDKQAYPPAASPETLRGGIHYVDRDLLSNKFSNYFPVMKWRKSASDSDFLHEEEFQSLLSFCKKSLEND